MFGAALALASAAFFGLNNATVRRGVLTSTVLQGMAVTVPLGVPLFVLFAAVMGGFDALAAWPLSSFAWMVLAGVIHFVVGRYGNYRATQALGSTLSTPIQQLSILVALALGLAFLDEMLSLLKLLGIVLVIGGPMMMARRRRTVTAKGDSKGFQPDYAAGTLWGSVCALGYGASPLFIALGLEAGGGELADSVGGVLVSYVAAAVLVAGLVVAAGGRSYMAGLSAGSMRWFLLSTLFVALSQLFRYLALAVAPIVVVVPIQRLSVVFRLLFNALMNREHEVFDAWVVGSILLAVVGAVALAGNGEIMLGALALPEAAIRLFASPLF